VKQFTSFSCCCKRLETLELSALKRIRSQMYIKLTPDLVGSQRDKWEVQIHNKRLIPGVLLDIYFLPAKRRASSFTSQHQKFSAAK
jgi:hypothetical protein